MGNDYVRGRWQRRWQTRLVCLAMFALPSIGVGAAPDTSATALPILPAARLTFDDLIALSRQGMDAEALITIIRQAGAYYRLSANDVIALRDRGLPLAVIDHILSAERQFLVGVETITRTSSRPATDQTTDQRQPSGDAPHRVIPALYLGV